VTLGPRYRNDLRLSEVNWNDLSKGRDTRTTLRLRCLPRKLCDEDAFRMALSHAGLSEHVDCFRVFSSEGRKTGSALVNASSGSGVAAVAKYVHGRQWGRSMPVAVSFAAVQGSAELRRAFPSKTLFSESRVAQLAKAAEPWRIETCELVAGITESEPAGVSEVSTEAGDDAELTAGASLRGAS